MPVSSRPGGGTTRVAEPVDDFEALRALLVEPEQRRLQALEARLDDPITHARDVGRVLPQALLARARDAELAQALTPPVERAITASVRRNPHPLAEALFPVMGPAIRKAVAASLAAMVESLNRTLEHSLSWRSLQWRLTAVRTGRPFAEVVLLHTLLYRVEQVFLIHRATGLLLMHVRAGSGAVEDADMVSGMLTAIREFVRDSFRVAESASLDEFKVGDLSVVIEQGPQAFIAAVVRGGAPRALRETLQQALETVHLQQGDALAAYEGDASAFEDARPTLETCLQSAYRAEERRSRRAVWAVVVLVALVSGLVAAWWLRDRARWHSYLDTVRAEPGLVVVSSGSWLGRHRVTGLRDPLARDPGELLAASQLSPAAVDARWEPFQALAPGLVLERAGRLLRPPPGVTLRLEDGVLLATGEAPAAWIADAERLAPFIAGVTSLDRRDVLAAALADASSRLEELAIVFARGSTRMLPGQEALMGTVASLLDELDALARLRGGEAIRVVIVGHADADGGNETNMPLSLARARAMQALFGSPARPGLEMTAVARGSLQPASSGRTEEDLQRNRRVQFTVAGAQARPETSEPR